MAVTCEKMWLKLFGQTQISEGPNIIYHLNSVDTIDIYE